jgi:hypothetical protein
LNLNREPANDSDLNILDIIAFTAAVVVTTIIIKAILRVGLATLSLPLLDILSLSSYFIIKDSQNITLGYTVRYLLIGLKSIRLYIYIV